MTYSSFLARFGAVATLIAIRSAAAEPPAPRWTRAQYDPWFGADPLYRSAWAGVSA
jgi:hypothetical protein